MFNNTSCIFLDNYPPSKKCPVAGRRFECNGPFLNGFVKTSGLVGGGTVKTSASVGGDTFALVKTIGEFSS